MQQTYTPLLVAINGTWCGFHWSGEDRGVIEPESSNIMGLGLLHYANHKLTCSTIGLKSRQ
jgi:hypothetical protein